MQSDCDTCRAGAHGSGKPAGQWLELRFYPQLENYCCIGILIVRFIPAVPAIETSWERVAIDASVDHAKLKLKLVGAAFTFFAQCVAEVRFLTPYIKFILAPAA